MREFSSLSFDCLQSDEKVRHEKEQKSKKKTKKPKNGKKMKNPKKKKAKNCSHFFLSLWEKTQASLREKEEEEEARE